MNISRNLEFDLHWAARLALPFEACGYVAHTDRLIPIRNVAEDGETEFKMDPQAAINAHVNAAAFGQNIVAVYHSHPAGGADWSDNDIEHFVPNLTNILVPIGGTILVVEPGEVAGLKREMRARRAGRDGG